MFRLVRCSGLVVLVAVAALPGVARGQARPGEGRLELVEAVPRDDLTATVSAAISPDGRFLYSSAWSAASLTVFARDAQSGRLEHRQTVTSDTLLAGTTALTPSPDGRTAIATAFTSRTAVLYLRNPDTGALSQADFARDGDQGVRFQWPIDVAFSPDGRFAYVIDDHGPAEGSQGAVVAFRVQDGKLEHVANDEGRDGCYSGARGLALSPDGKTLMVASYRAGALVVADRDATRGTTTVRQVIKDDEGPARSLAGAMGVAISRDGRHAYVSAGRFSGDNAVSAFAIDADGRLGFLQEFRNGEGELQNFEGGNEIAVSPDGRNVYAVATRSGTVAAFRRDPASGRLRYLETLPDGADAGENRAAGIGISPDGRFVYVATEDGRAISVFRRDAARDP
jgi:6-phosphogluconolactonase (cycloisomerase 2 family)